MGRGSRNFCMRTAAYTDKWMCCIVIENALVAVEEFFERDPQFNLCYCEDCLKGRKDKKKYERGLPPKKYTLPTGWARFSLK